MAAITEEDVLDALHNVGNSHDPQKAVFALLAQAWNEGAHTATMDYGIGEAVNPYKEG